MNETSTIRPGVDHQLRDLGDAADVLDAVGVGEAEVAVEAVADVVAVEQVGVVPAAVQLALDQVGDRRLAGAGEAGQPEHLRLLVQASRRAPACRSSAPASETFCERRRAKWISPAPTVALVIRSIRMKPPVSRFSR